MRTWKASNALKLGALAVVALTMSAGWAVAADRDRIRIPVGRGEVVPSTEDVRTVAIAEPKVADAAVGSPRTVFVNAKAPGTTTLVVYTEGGHFKVYDVDVFEPNSEKQVMLNVHVSELNATAKRELGLDLLANGQNNVRWLDGALSGGLFTTKVEPPTVPLSIGQSTDGFIGYTRNDGRFAGSTTWRALEEKGDIRTLANPTLLASSGQKASFLDGGQFPVPVSTASTASGGGGTGTVIVNSAGVTIEWKDFGVKVDFTPVVMDDGSIFLTVAPEVSRLDFTNPVSIGGFRVPIIISRKASTNVHLMPGENLVIGGLKQTDNEKSRKRVPILGEIPILGWFFTTTLTSKVEHELLIVVSPEMLTASNHMPPMPTDRPEKK
ncbi:MAG TPA: pilus assembly protein N-terminal domain-containing protein [Candidatus Udaeobacter sp.]|nr:pilus assembly protein N-terminal domain-containing protein [Candidatus Udaeobacter sp.]